MAPELLLVLIALALGYLARRTGRFPPEAADTLNRFVIDVCLPALILRLLPDMRLRWELLALVVTPWALAAQAALFTAAARRALRLDRASAAAVLLCSALGNTSFLGFPLCSALLGRDSLPLAAVYDQLGSFLLLCTLTPLVIARAAGSSAPSGRDVLRRIASFPPFIALLLALLPVAHPRWLDGLLDALAAALVPAALFAVGLRLRFTPPRELRAFSFALSLKLLVLPLCALLLGRALGAPAEVLEVAVVESAMPAMITAGAVLMAAGIASDLAAALVGWGILLAQLTVPAWALVVRALTR